MGGKGSGREGRGVERRGREGEERAMSPQYLEKVYAYGCRLIEDYLFVVFCVVDMIVISLSTTCN